MTELQHETSEVKSGRQPLQLVRDVIEKDDGRYLIYFTFRAGAAAGSDTGDSEKGEDKD